MPSNSVHLCVTSPPYDNLRTYNGTSEWNFPAVAAEIYRLLVDGGACCWVVGDAVVGGSETLTSFRQAIYFKDVVGFNVHDTMIYKKLNFSHPEKTRYHQTFEYMFILSKGNPRVFNGIKDRKNKTAGCVGNLGVNTFTERDGTKSVRSKKVTAEFGMRHNVWEGRTRGQEDMCCVLKHPAMMPKWIARDLMFSWSNEGDTVLDPFAGSGTTGGEALSINRKPILIELNDTYFQALEQKFSSRLEQAA